MLLYGPNSGPSGRAIANLIGCQSHGSRDDSPNSRDWPYLIRWGSAQRISHRVGFTLNKRDALVRKADRLDQLTDLRQHGVSVIRSSASRSAALSWERTVDRIVYRRQISGSYTQGRGLDISEPTSLPSSGVHSFYEYVPKVKQFRVWVVGHRTRLRELRGGDTDSLVWNHGNGFTYMMPTEQSPLTRRVRSTAIHAVVSLGLDFGAVDVGVRSNSNGALEPVVFEVNSAPGIDVSGEWMADQLRSLIIGAGHVL
jgi:hypothetical protein